ncbi:hypothetical protein HOP50_11g61970 [Chloropicon primus]|uniref:Tudor domain-containing protein n=2 Tax=Chloropicon primus TaxID=1764295 RepID=A0A5B8MTJ9_9CHLO|nr:hypothetical protein A3770_11p61750 [Chloropicon primus]UPR02870.1 hypothetical protein HOP50_11g61970 [Chloropicon primus]|eukprot:QDZ23657.1 hypothetical protein A3770_11p61750 [Chloropicon primus]
MGVKLVPKAKDKALGKEKQKQKPVAVKPALAIPRYLNALGRTCKVFWKEENAYYSGKILDVRKAFRAKHEVANEDVLAKGLKEVTIKKAFFIEYDDGDKEWLSIEKFEIAGGQGGQVLITESLQLDYYFDSGSKQFKPGKEYVPKSIEDRKKEGSMELIERERKAKEEHGEQERRKSVERASQKRKANQIEIKPGEEQSAKVRKAEGIAKAKHVLQTSSEKKKSLKPPGKRNCGAGRSLSGDFSIPTTSGTPLPAAVGAAKQGERPDSARTVSSIASSLHEIRMEDPKFKRCYDALVRAFESNPKERIALTREDWGHWNMHRHAAEKRDEWWEAKERDVLQRVLGHLQ